MQQGNYSICTKMEKYKDATMEERIVKMLVLARMAKLTCLIREGTIRLETLNGLFAENGQKGINDFEIYQLKRVVYQKKRAMLYNLGHKGKAHLK